MSESKSAPFMIVGAVQELTENNQSQQLIAFKQADDSDFYKAIAYVGNDKELIKSIAERFAGKNEFWIQPKALYDSFKGLKPFIEKVLSAEKKIDLKQDLSDLAVIEDASLKKAWESLFYVLIMDGPSEMVAHLQHLIRIAFLQQKMISNGGNHTTEFNRISWRRLYVQLPNPPFPLRRAVQPDLPTSSTDSDDSSAQDCVEDIPSREDIFKAREEIVRLHKMQLVRKKSELQSFEAFKASFEDIQNEDIESGTSPDRPEVKAEDQYEKYLEEQKLTLLDQKSQQSLSSDTRKTLSTIGFDTSRVDVMETVAFLDQELAYTPALTSEDLSFQNEEMMLQIGTELIAINLVNLLQGLCSDSKPMDHCKLLAHLLQKNWEKSRVQVSGIGRAYVISQELKEYKATELAHSEPIMAGEVKEKTHRNLKRSETTFETSTEQSETTETDTRTSERLSLNKATNDQLQSYSSLEAGLNVSAGFGPVSVSASLNYATASAEASANASAISSAKETTERAVRRVEETVRERKMFTTINEVETTNLHRIDNTGNNAQNGFYYWINKVYTNQVMQIGKRLMLECIIPEPAAFYVYCKAIQPKEGQAISKPIHPGQQTFGGTTSPLKSFKDLTRSNYHQWVSMYEVMEATSPPDEFYTTAKSYSMSYQPGANLWNDKHYSDLTVKQGYEAIIGKLNLKFSSGSGRYIHGFLGNRSWYGSTGFQTTLTLDKERDIVPLAFRGKFGEYAMTVEVKCQLTEEGYNKWRIDTYNAIVQGYQRQLEAYESAAAALDIEAGINIEGQNPLYNRKTIEDELKKWSIGFMTGKYFTEFDAMKRAANAYPELDYAEAEKEGKEIRFFEQAVEWQNMTYKFYPYFWGAKNRWTVLKSLDDSDSLFRDFLRSGAVRVVFPVRPEFTAAILHYLDTQEIWEGEDLPVIGDDLYVSIIDEIKDAETNSDAIPVGDPWETTVPTSMVMITDDVPSDLPGSV